ncbi:transcriptional regulator [Candidatus Geothermarchaeota archaeon]|nr:MAG: transcriptional regulator [Candidatus Geothermarchaeota archaeon]RLG61455.1 MAG: transcriptional regulator [Candidatus Geothermarchaeota archaeon]HEW94095.1 Lrp/AsnC family transcriptional regulator [Thermoprotei archaeon]
MVRISDIKLIKILLTNSRLPYTKIADELGVTEAAIRKRIKKLESQGVIKKYTIYVDPKAMGYNYDVLIGLDTTPEKFISILNILKEDEKVIELYTSTGDHMILIRTWLKDSKELDSYIRYLESMEGVTKVCPAIIIERIK